MDEFKRQNLFKAIATSYRTLENFRTLNRNLVEEYAGSGYGPPGRTKYEVMVNLMNQAVDAYIMALVANRPRVMVSSQNPRLRYFAKNYQQAINYYIEDIGLEYKLKKWVLDAFFCVGIMKTHMADAGAVFLGNDTWVDPGKPYASNVSLDNFVFDASATNWSEVKFAGDFYRIPFDELQSEIYDQEAVKELAPNSKYAPTDDRLQMIGRGTEVDQDEFEPMIDLADVWIPREGKIYTFAVKQRSTFTLSGRPLAEMDWDGPEHGPYHILGFNDVPENIMPTSPASHLASLSRLINNLTRKQSRRARNQKKLHLYTPAGVDAAKRMQKAGDDQFIEAQDVSEFAEHTVGGVDPSTEQFRVGLVNEFDRMAGNLPAMLGLGPSAETASQENLIQGAVSKKVAAMQYRVVDASVKLIRDLGHMMWNDQFLRIKTQSQIEGTDFTLDYEWTPEERHGSYDDYDINIDMHSMPYQAPSAKIQAINQLITQIYAPLSNLLMQQGGSYNLQELTNLYAELGNLPQLRQVIQFATPDPSEPSGATTTKDRDVPMPQGTERNYVRRNISSGGTQQGQQLQRQQAWAAMNQE